MCGIFFIKGQYNYEILNNYFMKGQSRGPDNSKLECVNENTTIGFHRLMINGLNDISNQPIVKNGIYLICNGEIYNYKELYYYLNLNPTTNSDCEIIIDLYLTYPIEYFIKLLDGVFSFIIYDSNLNTYSVGRDPFGVRSMFCNHNFTSFSSELKQLMFLDQQLKQFPPGHCYTNNKLIKYHSIGDYILPNCSNNNTYTTEYKFYTNLVRTTLVKAVKKRLLSDRPIACLLSGGLDSSLITSIVCNLSPGIQVETYSIGLQGSTDLHYAKIISDYLNTNHTEIIVTEDEFFSAIPEVIKRIESYDTTTVRASVGNYLISKYISENSQAKVIFNGDGADELAGGYLYFNNAPTSLDFNYEIHKLLNNIHYFDVLRSDRTVSSCGLEPRTPFLDKTFVNMYLSIPLYIRNQNNVIEKKLIRDSFQDLIPDSVLYRKKEAFSDGVSSTGNSWYKIIEKKVNSIQLPDTFYEFNTPTTQEQKYYRYLFETEFTEKGAVIPYFWMPKWTNSTDPSARTL